MRICLVTPFAWSQPHDVNEHVAGVADGLRALGHEVTVLAPSTRAADLLAGRRVVHGHAPPQDVVAVGPAVPVSRRSQMGVPVGVRANLRLALARGGFDLVHGFEPGLPSLSYLALRETDALTVATFCSTDRLGYPPARSQREKLLARIDALLALSEPVRDAAAERFPGDYGLVSPGVDLELFAPAPKRDGSSSSCGRTSGRWRASVLRALRELPGLGGGAAADDAARRPARDPARPRRPRHRADGPRRRLARAALFAPTAIFVPGIEGSHVCCSRLRLRAAPFAAPPGSTTSPSSAAAAVGAPRRRRGAPGAGTGGGARGGRAQSFSAVAAQLTTSTPARRAAAAAAPADPLADRPWIVADLHMHTNWSFDCKVDPAELVDHALAEGLGAIAITDHNAFGGALETVDEARDRDLIVIPGEEIKTDAQGEVIGLFLEREIPRGLSFEDTIAAIREQNGLVYIPHPFDRMHTIPDPATLHRHLADIDVLEVYNARLIFEAQNDEALRFARKYDLTMGAGSDAHVLPGVGTGALRMRSFGDPEEFLISLRSAEILRRPKSLAYLQSLKWMAQVKEKVR